MLNCIGIMFQDIEELVNQNLLGTPCRVALFLFGHLPFPAPCKDYLSRVITEIKGNNAPGDAYH